MPGRSPAIWLAENPPSLVIGSRFCPNATCAPSSFSRAFPLLVFCARTLAFLFIYLSTFNLAQHRSSLIRWRVDMLTHYPFSSIFPAWNLDGGLFFITVEYPLPTRSVCWRCPNLFLCALSLVEVRSREWESERGNHLALQPIRREEWNYPRAHVPARRPSTCSKSFWMRGREERRKNAKNKKKRERGRERGRGGVRETEGPREACNLFRK